MCGFFLGLILGLILLIATFILTNTVTLSTDISREKESQEMTCRCRFNWRLWKNCWKFHILPCIRLKYKENPEEGILKRFDITLGWLFAFIRIEFLWIKK